MTPCHPTLAYSLLLLANRAARHSQNNAKDCPPPTSTSTTPEPSLLPHPLFCATLQLEGSSLVNMQGCLADVQMENCFGVVTPSRTYYIQGKSPAECREWMRVVAIIARSKSGGSHQHDEPDEHKDDLASSSASAGSASRTSASGPGRASNSTAAAGDSSGSTGGGQRLQAQQGPVPTRGSVRAHGAQQPMEFVSHTREFAKLRETVSDGAAPHLALPSPRSRQPAAAFSCRTRGYTDGKLSA